jgi:hypothetical protein
MILTFRYVEHVFNMCSIIMNLPLEVSKYIQDFLRPTKKDLGTFLLKHHYKTLCLRTDRFVTYTFIPDPTKNIKYMMHLHVLYFITIEKICNGKQTAVSFHYKWTIQYHPNRTFTIPLYDGILLHSSMSCSNPHPLIHYNTYYSDVMSYEYFLTRETKGNCYK